MSKPFKLSVALYGHSLDVRSLSVSSRNLIVTGSRDKSAKLWTPNGTNPGYTENITYKDQKNYVACVLYLENTTDYPDGVIITGGADNVILIYKPHEPFSTYAIKEHTNAVCYLTKGLEQDRFISCSWDGTAKMWNLNKPQVALTTFSGHTAAVWSAIQISNGTVITGSADKTIGLFSRDGFRINTIQGHNDCVRGLEDIPELNCFISVSNDATIKVWNYNGAIVDTYYGHTNYIYGIARNKASGDNCFVTSDEDRTVRYWKNGINTETIYLPAQSVWTVACLTNGDIVTGSSDSIVRIFTQDENRYASDELLKSFQQEVDAFAKQSVQEIGGYKVSDLPGKEALYEPGKKLGEMKMIREAEGVVAYTWIEEGENSRWEKVGDVLGGADPNAGSKTTYEGKAYDFVFSVDVEDGKPPLKLPYNKGDDPYVAAHNFLEKNMLPSTYLDQVVDFILNNSKDGTETHSSGSDYVDPFTGSARYQPSSTNKTYTNTSGANVDLFTGSSSYSTIPPNAAPQTLFPQDQYRSFDLGDPNLILRKLKEFNQKAGPDNGVDETHLENVVTLCSGPKLDNSCYETLFKLIGWGDDKVFPVLDVLRMALRYEDNNRVIALENGETIMERLKYFISQDCHSPNCALVAFRALCNMFLHKWGENLIFKERVELLENITSLSVGNKNIQIALATFLLNITILCGKSQDEFGLTLLACVTPDIVARYEDAEAQFRGLIAIGTLLSTCKLEHRRMIRDKVKENSNFVQKLSELANGAEPKTTNCAKLVLLEINK